MSKGTVSRPSMIEELRRRKFKYKDRCDRTDKYRDPQGRTVYLPWQDRIAHAWIRATFGRGADVEGFIARVEVEERAALAPPAAPVPEKQVAELENVAPEFEERLQTADEPSDEQPA